MFYCPRNIRCRQINNWLANAHRNASWPASLSRDASSRSISSREQWLLSRLSMLHAVVLIMSDEVFMAYLHHFCDLHCPYCNRTTDFQLLHASPLREKHKNADNRITWHDSNRQFRGLFVCASCHNPLTIDISLKNNADSGNPFYEVHRFLNRLSLDFVRQSARTTQQNYASMTISCDSMGYDLAPYFRIDAMYPDAGMEMPEALPDLISRHYRENILGASSPTMIVTGCRKTLEAVCREQLGCKDKLSVLIEKLTTKGVIPESLKSWAHTIRIFGNSATHDTDDFFTDEEATEIRNITRMLLEFIYSYPARIERLRNKLHNR
ncbi:DUF4145 domain-containing protein [Salmonella enterica subsp. salamae]|uniref:DUF4145 domain-containing protein n=1 Tax=Salmonella enterica subsp. salamae TaxID=59202 RepID=A0A5Y1WBJ9_SALER|nr:DUF4145 domain-containing protein [Salmonella enterica subsp. salamae]ECD9354095.1 DUF4145 domain-containing protein [Salmonella enterica subsp. salamae]ECL1759067.1 DUF4145 domain-containing protein [Salmonella enterica]